MVGDAKRLVLRPIRRPDADALVRRVHYSGKVVSNSRLHIGVFYDGRLEGAMQFGPPLDTRKVMGLVSGTPWHGFLELNRLAFSERLPRNSESRALSVAMRFLRQYAPQVQWVLSFADAAQCGDGTIYRAAGFVLTGIKPNKQVWTLPDGYRFAAKTVSALGRNGGEQVRQEVAARTGVCVGDDGASSMRVIRAAGAVPLPGFQLRYLYFLDPTACARLTVPIIPFREIRRRGAAMYRGQPLSCATSIAADAPADQAGEGGSIPTVALPCS